MKKAHKGFQNAVSEIQKINDKLDIDLQDIAVTEKTIVDRLRQLQEDIAKLEKRGKVLLNERSELKRQLSVDEENLRRERKFLEEKIKKLEKEEGERVPKYAAAGFLARFLFDPAGALLGGTVGGVATKEALKNKIEKAERVVREASYQVHRTRSRIDDKISELSNLEDQKEKQRENKTTKIRELEELQLRKKEKKDSRVRLVKLNESFESFMVQASTFITRAKVMAVEANGELPDIEAMIFPLKTIAGDLFKPYLKKSRLLSGNVDLKGIRCKIQMITYKLQPPVTQGDMDVRAK